MFEQVFLENKDTTRKPWTIALGFILQCFSIGILILIPLIYTEALPRQQLMGFLMSPPPPPPPPPPPAAAPPVMAKPVIREIEDGRLIAPKAIPKTIVMVKEDEVPAPTAGAVGVLGGVPGGVPGGQMGGVLGSIITETNRNATPPPPPPPPKVEVKRIKVGGQVQAAMLISQPKPVYPPLARSARVQGHVILAAVISKQGTIEGLAVISGHPMLIPAALEAVRQWRYKPTILNNEPVEVDTTIDVNFTLSN